MTDMELMVGFFAYDTGCTDSGIHDEVAKEDLFNQMHKEQGIAKIVTEYARWLLSEEGEKNGYTLEDVRAFIDWLDDNGYAI